MYKKCKLNIKYLELSYGYIPEMKTLEQERMTYPRDKMIVKITIFPDYFSYMIFSQFYSHLIFGQNIYLQN